MGDLAGREEKTVHPRGALDQEPLGLFPGSDFQLTTGAQQTGDAFRAAFWYFRDEVIAVPRPGLPQVSLTQVRLSYPEVLQQAAALAEREVLPYPCLAWVGSPLLLSGMTLTPDGTRITDPAGKSLSLSLAPRLPTNRSYYNGASTAFFRTRPLRLRGTSPRPDKFLSRTLWPEDFRLEPEKLKPRPLRANETLAELITAEKGGVASPFQARLLWERQPGRAHQWAGRTVLAFVLSGAQGDDHESQAGHWAGATGRLGPRGEFADWLVSNFYALDEVSEKGILPALMPMDNYLMDLNSGQAYYRPVCLLALVLSQDRAARRFQAAMEVVFPYYYRHDFAYQYAWRNSTALTIDLLRTLGWRIPQRGPSGRLMAVLAFLYLLFKERRPGSARSMFANYWAEQTRLLPRVAFEAAGNDLLQLLLSPPGQPPRNLTPFEQILRDDVEAVLFARMPQIPSSRPLGTYGVASLEEYRKRVPEDRSQWKTADVKPREFPNELRAES